MGKEQHYENYIRGKSAEEILATGAGAITGPIGDFIRVSAAVRTNQELITALNRASRESGQLANRVVLLTGALVAVGVLQAVATGWPYITAYWKH
jgi:hypothetical protein